MDQHIRCSPSRSTLQVLDVLALRAKIVLRCPEGGMDKQAAADLGVDASAVDRWRARFIAERRVTPSGTGDRTDGWMDGWRRPVPSDRGTGRSPNRCEGTSPRGLRTRG
ncbi:helix-turn-helix domain-containing protein [Streptomyces sp. NBC_00233]|uniref:helix-turn-helix domain-containing protein n=1 Tax=Streptomyces sp. NBC_00233 TaxID=2975686 RepID=UPI00224D7FB6|nr:helix-turn-helix domain-containing protein [Streptomyces sp. NBC_00233]MCX5233370.1 helix-turn-helix domain-containing protein [Streptomyces sp. NBC_00233]